MAHKPIFQSSIFDSDLFSADHSTVIFQANIFDSDLFTPTVITRIFQANIFDSDLFQNSVLSALYDRDVYQNNVYQGIYTPPLANVKVFQANIFDNKVFQTDYIESKRGKFVFQQGTYQQSIFNVPNQIIQVINELISIKEVEVHYTGFPKIPDSDKVSIALSVYKVLGITKTLTDRNTMDEVLVRYRDRKTIKLESESINEYVLFAKRTRKSDIPTVYQSTIFQSTVFQKSYNPTVTQINTVFQSNIFDSRLFQKSQNPQEIPSLFQKDIFQSDVFQRDYNLSQVTRSVFQTGLFQSGLFHITIKKVVVVNDTITIDDILDWHTGLAPVISDKISLSETYALGSGRDWIQTINDYLSIQESSVNISDIIKILSESSSIVDINTLLKYRDPNIIFKVFTSIYQTGVFQKRYNLTRTSIPDVFQSIFQSNLFQNSFNPTITPKIFQSIFQDKVFQTKTFDGIIPLKKIFQTGVFQYLVYQVSKTKINVLYDTVSTTETLSKRIITKIVQTVSDTVSLTDVASKGKPSVVRYK